MSSRTRGWLVALVGTVLVAAFVITCTPFVRFGRPAPWELARQPSADATRVDVVVLGGGCGADDERLGEVSVDESPQRVVITAAIRKPVDVISGVCPAVLRLHPATVELRAPLGRRTLIDGRTGEPPPTPSDVLGNRWRSNVQNRPVCRNRETQRRARGHWMAQSSNRRPGASQQRNIRHYQRDGE